MENFNDILTVLTIAALLLIMKFNREYMNTKYVCNQLDGRCYGIIADHQDHEQASMLLAQLNKFGIRFMRHLREKYILSNNKSYRKEIFQRLLHNYNPEAIIENMPTSIENTSYVEDKGRVFALCLRKKPNNQFHDIDLIKFVFLHEMSHLASKGYGHGKEFWINFKIMLDEAYQAGLYYPKNYMKYPENYCGLHIDYNPYFDDSIPNEM
jgi:hypothetical protein